MDGKRTSCPDCGCLLWRKKRGGSRWLSPSTPAKGRRRQHKPQAPRTGGERTCNCVFCVEPCGSVWRYLRESNYRTFARRSDCHAALFEPLIQRYLHQFQNSRRPDAEREQIYQPEQPNGKGSVKDGVSIRITIRSKMPLRSSRPEHHLAVGSPSRAPTHVTAASNFGTTLPPVR